MVPVSRWVLEVLSTSYLCFPHIIFENFFNGWIYVRAVSSKCKVLGQCRQPVGQQIQEKDLIRFGFPKANGSFSGMPSEPTVWVGGHAEQIPQVWRTIPIGSVDVVNWSPRRGLALCYDKHHLYFFSDVKWKEIILKLLNAGQGDPLVFVVRNSRCVLNLALGSWMYSLGSSSHFQLDYQLQGLHFYHQDELSLIYLNCVASWTEGKQMFSDHEKFLTITGNIFHLLFFLWSWIFWDYYRTHRFSSSHYSAPRCTCEDYKRI